MRFLGSVAVILALLVVSSVQASAQTPVCTERQIAQMAKALANREVAGLNRNIAFANFQLETEHQTRLTAALEEQIARSFAGVSQYVASVQPAMRAALEKSAPKLRAARAKQSASAIAAKQRLLESANTKFNRAFDKVPQLQCSLP